MKERCIHCGEEWHPPALCWAYQEFGAEYVERIAANIYNGYPADYEPPDIDTWESEGGR